MTIDLDCASRCQCLDINSLTWSDEIAKVLDVDFNALLPQPSKITDIIGTVTEEAAAETGLVSGIPVVAGCSDAMASMYATGLSQLGEAGESSGTTSLVFVGSPVQSRSDVPVVTKPCAIDGMPYILTDQSTLPALPSNGIWIPSDRLIKKKRKNLALTCMNI